MKLARTLSAALAAVALVAPAPARAESLTLDLGQGVTLEVVEVPAGTFEQGSRPTDPGHDEDEVLRSVTLSTPFFIGKTPVTYRQFERFADETHYRTEAEKGTSGGFGWNGSALVQKPEFNWRHPGYEPQPDDPVTIVTYGDALAFDDWLGRRASMTVRLPTEAEFERAAHGTGTTAFVWGADAAAAEKNAWFAKNAHDGPRPVDRMPANSLGLLGMSGNVWQWCSDYYAPITDQPVTDPRADTPTTWKLSEKPRRVLKGGSWRTDDRMKLRIAARYRATDGSRNADFGFRVVALRGAPTPPPSAPSPPTQPSTPAPSAAPPPSSSGGVPWGLVAGGVSLAGIGLYFATRPRRGAVSRPSPRVAPGSPYRARIGVDGFWIDAPDASDGDEVEYDARVDGRRVRGSARLTRSPRGTFVYTGSAPSDVTFIDTLASTQASTLPQSTPYEDLRSGSSSSSSGWPSAY